MRVPVFLLIALVAAAIMLGVGCGGEAHNQTNQQPEPATDTAPQMVAVPLPNPEEQLVSAAAEKMIEKFTVELKAELMKAMSQGNAASAIEICKEKAPLLASQFSTEGWTIRRMSLLNRNANNYPDAFNASYLQKFAADTSLKHLSIWKSEYHKRVFSYYKPIYLQAMCTTCHGKTEQMDPAVVAKLEEQYPGDRAVGFSEGDLRGMFVLTVLWPDGKPLAEKLVAESTH